MKIPIQKGEVYKQRADACRQRHSDHQEQFIVSHDRSGENLLELMRREQFGILFNDGMSRAVEQKPWLVNCC